MIPILTSALITEVSKIVERDRIYSVKFRILAKRQEIPEDQIEECVDGMMDLKEDFWKKVLGE
jgi:hypothetical protein